MGRCSASSLWTNLLSIYFPQKGGEKRLKLDQKDVMALEKNMDLWYLILELI
jgi:hypothetical protein